MPLKDLITRAEEEFRVNDHVHRSPETCHICIEIELVRGYVSEAYTLGLKDMKEAVEKGMPEIEKHNEHLKDELYTCFDCYDQEIEEDIISQSLAAIDKAYKELTKE